MNINKAVQDQNSSDDSSSSDNDEPAIKRRFIPGVMYSKAGSSKMAAEIPTISITHIPITVPDRITGRPTVIKLSRITIETDEAGPSGIRNANALALASRFPVSSKNDCRTPAERIIATFLPHMKPKPRSFFDNAKLLPKELAKIFDRIGALENEKNEEAKTEEEKNKEAKNKEAKNEEAKNEEAKNEEAKNEEAKNEEAKNENANEVIEDENKPDPEPAPPLATLDEREIRDFYDYLQEEELNFKDDFYQDFQKTLDKEIQQADMESATDDEAELLRKRKLEDALLGDKKRRLLSNFAGSTLLNLASMGRERSPVLSNSISFDVPDLSQWLLRFNSWSNDERLKAIDSLISGSGSDHVRDMLAVIEPFFQRDFISLLPRELSLKILRYLEPTDLLKASQTCNSWRYLADDDLLWKEQCNRVGITEERPRTRSMPPGPSTWKVTFMAQYIIGNNWLKNPLGQGRLLECNNDHIITCLQFYGNKLLSTDPRTMKMWSDVTQRMCNCREILAERAKRKERARLLEIERNARCRRILRDAYVRRTNRRTRRGRRHRN